MYCVKCGCRINPGEKYCSDCGADVSQIEYNGGFWGLVGEENRACSIRAENSVEDSTISESIEEKPIEKINDKGVEWSKEEFLEAKRQEARVKKKYKRNICIFMTLAVVLVLLCCGLTAGGFYLSKKYEKIKSNYYTSLREYGKLNNEYEILGEEYKDLKEEYDTSEKEHKALEEEYVTLEEEYKTLKEKYEDPNEEDDDAKKQTNGLKNSDTTDKQKTNDGDIINDKKSQINSTETNSTTEKNLDRNEKKEDIDE